MLTSFVLEDCAAAPSDLSAAPSSAQDEGESIPVIGPPGTAALPPFVQPGAPLGQVACVAVQEAQSPAADSSEHEVTPGADCSRLRSSRLPAGLVAARGGAAPSPLPSLSPAAGSALPDVTREQLQEGIRQYVQCAGVLMRQLPDKAKQEEVKALHARFQEAAKASVSAEPRGAAGFATAGAAPGMPGLRALACAAASGARSPARRDSTEHHLPLAALAFSLRRKASASCTRLCWTSK